MESYGKLYEVKYDDFVKWIKLGRSVKTQTNILGKIIGPSEVGSLLYNFLCWILLAFMIVNASEFSPVIIKSAAFFCFSNIVRLYVKTSWEQRIRNVVGPNESIFPELFIDYILIQIQFMHLFLGNANSTVHFKR